MSNETSVRCTRCGTMFHPQQVPLLGGICPRCLYDDVDPSVKIPETIGHLKIKGRIGSGGMGEVHLAEHERLGRIVAVKFLSPELANDAEVQKRFEREAKALALLNHPNIIMLHDFGQEKDLMYIVTEHVDSGNLAERLKSGPLRPSEAIKVTR